MNSLLLSDTDCTPYQDDYPLIDPARIPKHIAIMMDGNRRWAKARRLPSISGHWGGADSLTKIVRAASKLGIRVLTVYSLSTENMKRSQEEVDGLMHLVKTYLIQERENMINEGVRLDTIGDLAPLPSDVKHELALSRSATAHCNQIELVLALNYGGRDDIRRAAVALLDDCLKGKLSKEEISESVFARYLDTARWEDPELLIRAGGEQRLSNFLLWQISYSEVYITDVLWPDFTEKDLLLAIKEYQQREKRLGY